MESFYRDAKQELGMEDYEMRKIEGVRRHLEMVLIAHTFLVLGRCHLLQMMDPGSMGSV